MTSIHDRQITHPSAWKSSQIGGKEGLMHRFGPEHAAALMELVDRTRHLEPSEVTRAQFDHPLINDLMKGAREEIMNGRGAIILAGLDMETVSVEDYGRLYWGLGTHLGTGVIQSAKGDRIGYVQKEENNPTGRGYMLDIELRSHTDFHEILSLAAFRKAARGGESGIVSSLAIHNAMLQERPDQLKTLYEGFWHGYALPEHLTQEKVPIFCNVDGVVSCFAHLLFMISASKQMGVPFPEELTEALNTFQEIAHRPEIRADFMLEPGEMLFWHNFQMLHSRQAFTNEGEHKRLLLRLWLHTSPQRPMHPEFTNRARLMDELHVTAAPAIDYTKLGVGVPPEPVREKEPV